MDKRQERNSFIELLRILSMLAIMATHYVEINYLDGLDAMAISFNRVFLEYMRAGAKIGVNIFVLITGYFLIEKEFSRKRIWKLAGTVWFYSLVLDFIAYLTGWRELTLMNLLDTCFPILMQKHWFVTVFIGLYLISPFLNKGLKALDKQEHFRLIVLLLFMTSLIPTLTTKQYFYSNFIWFIVLYCVAAYIRLYVKDVANPHRFLLAGCGAFLLILLSILLFDWLGLRYAFLLEHRFYFTTINTVLTAFCAIGFFIFVTQMQAKCMKYINQISAAMFAVYLIHCSETGRVIWRYLWEPVPQDSVYVPVCAVISLIVMMAFCIVAESIRQKAGAKITDFWMKSKRRNV